MLKTFSTFSGIGGLEFGLRDWTELVGWSEIKESSCQVYENWYKSKNYGDITKIDFSQVPDFDLLTGGFPCQSFSMAGARKGFGDRRGQMIFYLYDLLVAKKPKYAVLENVKGLLSHDNGRTYRNIFSLLKNAGYFVRCVLLNSVYYGSAQSRERIYFLCSLEDFEKKIPVKVDDKVRFRDIREVGGKFKFIGDKERDQDKIEQKRIFNYELIGGYDRVGTLTTQYGCGEKVVYEGGEWRYLTPLECERLQGFPDGWTEGLSDANRYWALGNAVNCKVSDYLFKDYLKGLWW